MRTKHFFLFILLSILISSPLFSTSIDYIVTPKQPNTHVLHVEMTSATAGAKTLDVRIPAWRPGRYILQHFGRNVLSFAANDQNGKALNFEKIDKSTWRVQCKSTKSVTIAYDYYANEFDAGNTFYDDSEIYLNPITVLMYIAGREMQPVTLHIENPNAWPMATALEQDESGKLIAPNYHELADNPIFVSPNFTRQSFQVDGIENEVVMIGDQWRDEEELTSKLHDIVKASAEMFGGLPYKRYVFLYHFVDYRQGHGVEHKNSTSIVSGPANFREESYLRRLLGLSTHEFFHVWNVERIRPAAILHADYSKEQYSTLFWFFEGGTSYYTPLILQRAGLLTRKKFIGEFVSAINSYNSDEARKNMSASKSSFESWTYSMGHYPPNYVYNFYSAGKMIGLALDLEIRQRTENAKSLDDVMRYLWKNFGSKMKGLPEDGVQKAVEKVSGSNFDAFFEKYVEGTETLDFEKIMGYAGLKMEVKSPEDSSKIFFGVSLRGDNKETTIRNIVPGSPASIGGLDFDDQLIALNKRRAHRDNFTSLLKDYQPGDTVAVTVMRREKLREFDVILAPWPESYTDIKLEPVENPTELQTAILDGWAGKEEVKKDDENKTEDSNK